MIPYLLEEAHEVADAVRSGDDGELAGELGDLVLNVAFQIVLAEERESFDADGVVARLEQKMEARHPHVYGDAEEAPDWERLKAAERHAPGGGDSAADPLSGIPAGIEPLSRALRVQERAAGVGFDWPDPTGAIAKLREEVEELEAVLDGRAGSPSSSAASPSPEIVEEAGDLLFAVVNVCRLIGAHPQVALDGATSKFARRFRRVAELTELDGLDMTSAGLEALDRIWDAVKQEEREGA